MVYWGGYRAASSPSVGPLAATAAPVCLVLHFPREQVPYRYNEFEWTGLAQDADLVVGVGGL